MTKAIIESASGHACADLELEPLQRKLIDLLQRKRYLLVLDDVWDDEQENWLRLKPVLASGGKGASILVTTRLPKVAAIMGTMPSHELSMLSDSDCWELFKQRAFGPNEVEPTELLGIGKEIVMKCGGVPLAAIALGSLLRFKREEKEWLYVKESKLWSLQGENSVMPALRLGYLNLPVNLRQCFAFCALFPKDEIISKHTLINLWMANGLIPSNEMLDAEDIGDEFWNQLYWRSFFQDIMTDELGKVTTFKMHDLIHDLAQSVTEEVCCSAVNNSTIDVSERIRHLSIYGQNSFQEANVIQLHRFKSLKTCIVRESCYGGKILPQVFKCYSLRVLDFRGLENLSTSIGHLKYLRYLDISFGKFKSLPESLCRLWNLQILKLDHCSRLQKLPASLVRLKALRHLSLRHCHSLSRLPPQMGKLTCLRTLNMYFVGKEKGFHLAELGQLNLKGELHIKHLERVKSVMDAKEANMSRKHLNHLQLSWGKDQESQSQENVEHILEWLQPHTQKLQILLVSGYTGAYFPQWMSSSSLKYLDSLELVDCKSCLHLPQLGKLPCLKYLRICNMSRAKYLYEESCDAGIFIALEYLILEKIPNLIRLSREDGVNMFPSLSKIKMTECPQLLGLPCLVSLKSLQIEGKCNQYLPSSICNFPRLEHLYFGGNDELTCFPSGMLSRNLTSLKRLEINGYSKLEELLPNEIVNLAVPQHLIIYRCESLKSLTNGVLRGFHSLKILAISWCPEFNLSAGFQYLTSLEKLMIDNCAEMKGLHEALQRMTTLQSLILSNLPSLESLPAYLGNLSSLQSLTISGCPKLTCLPMSIQCLSCLERLQIEGCKELGKRCQKEIGEDWPKIAHVPHVEVMDKQLLIKSY